MTLSSKRLFLIDAVGALFSSIMLGLVLTRFQNIFGIPVSILKILAIIPIGFIVFDIFSFYAHHSRTSIDLKTIAMLNCLYCLLSLILTFTHRDQILVMGWLYILSEIIIVLYLARIEYRAALKLKNV